MVYSEKFYVGFSDCNRELKITNSSMLKLFENVACMHSTSIGDGIKNSLGRWFLTAYHVKVHNRPENEDRVKIDTWSRDMKGGVAAREFEVYNFDGELAVTAISNWVRISAEDLRPEKITDELANMYDSETERTNFGTAWLRKLKECDDYVYEKEVTIPRTFIDAHNHMNNVFYLELANLVLPEEVYQQGECNEFEIMYRKAIEYGETVKCVYSETEDSYVIALKSQDGSELKAIIKLYK